GSQLFGAPHLPLVSKSQNIGFQAWIQSGQNPWPSNDDQSSLTNSVYLTPGVSPVRTDSEVSLDRPNRKLAGWLTRHRRKGFIKTSDQKWYQFDDDRCKMLAFNGPADTVPLETIDIARAAFTVDLEFSDKPACFSLSIDGQSINLEAPSSEDMKEWIRELQKRRELYLRSKSIDGISGTQNCSTKIKILRRELIKSGSDSDVIQAALALSGGDTSAFISFNDVLSSDNRNGISERAKPDSTRVTAPPVTKSESSERAPKKSSVTALKNIFSTDKSQQKFDKAMEDRYLVMKDELQMAKDELSANKEIVRILRHQLDFATKEKEALKTLVGNTDTEQSQLKILRDRCRHILELEDTLRTMRSENEGLHQRNQILKSELMEIAQQTSGLRDDLRMKDRAIVLLNEQMAQMEKNGPREGRALSQRSVNETEDQLQRTKEMLAAYKDKLAYLNEEIVGQNAMRNDMAVREQKLLATLADWEAKYARLESRHLFNLKDFTQRSSEGTATDADVAKIKQMILDEALGGSEESSHEKALLECDRYGFFTSRLHYTNEEYLERKALEANRKEHMAKIRQDPFFMEHLHRWESFLAKQTRLIQKTEELKNLMRIGCPDEHRSRVWKSAIEWSVASVKTMKGPKYYQSLVHETSSPLASAAAKQIKIDLCRTLPNNIHFMNMDSDMIPKLEEVLVSFSKHNPGIGYCQGMNRLAAVALLFLNEEDCFWCLVAIVDYYLPGYFSVNMLEAQVDQRIFRDLFAEKLPRLYAHLSSFLDVTLYSFNWFLTVFVDNMHPDIFLPIWDAFLVEGKKILFRFSIAMFKYFEDELLQLTDPTVANRFLRNLGDRVTDLKKLQNVAFQTLNPFPMKFIKARRAVHLPEILAEMRQLDQLRASIPQTSGAADDDDE
ncbi:TBC1 domain family member 2B-like, partial [Paramacrobiotus metropolitanus]|uniref:TBC1 domain family member 2B-like n=1 Tax=Paramacrobiotus metropolitanus TaxID=2943436 RepID=UPI0024460EB7